MKTELYLIRHGETTWNAERRFQGHADIPLSTDGINQAKRLGKYLLNQTIDVVYASDLMRAYQTAQHVAVLHGLKVNKTAHFRERNVGEWEGLTIDELSSRFPDWEQVSPHGGTYGVEKTVDVEKRMVDQLNQIVTNNTGKRIVIVSHGMALNVLLTGILGESQKQRIQNTSITHLIHSASSGYTLLRLNQIDHLQN
ncbi:histidine phosphatase family protein [Hazenella sp. IB182357]|uniref:Histidine phosphatase family protein n=1 Tax=Polycladospora coralii TaxID=2771432 RepID=A0A926N9G2_9BACL|nr:histidine phosphatase family protein [Polycladospora coralii]MBD1370940.1 histidine phosphatase family protein [Polycladospora coralii]MBS7529879.1 histidine phosphatase family protein [Polycladospora coralii]